MAKTFDTSRVGGGTYELEQDSSGNYKLKSVGFAQVNKLNLPDLKTSDTTTTTPKTEEKKTNVADPFKKLAAQNTSSGGGGSNQDYSGVMLKTPEVKDVSVRSAGEMTNTTYNAMSDAEKNAIATGTATVDRQVETGAPGDNQFETVKEPMTFTGATGTETYKTPRTISDQNKYLGRTFTERTTGLQKVQSAVQNTVGNVIDSVRNNKAIKVASTVLGFALNPVMAGVKMVAGVLKDSPTQKMNRGYFNTNEGSQRISGNPATDLYAGMNRTSDFGNLENAGNKRIATREATIARREKSGKPMSDKFKSDTANMKDQAREYKQTKETATDTSPGATGGEGGNNSSDSGRVICTDLHRTGELSTRDWVRDTKFTFKTLSITHVKGYLLWAEPTVKHMQKYPKYRKMWKHIAQHRANDIAWRLNEGKFDLLGRIYAGIGEPVCWALGNFVSDKQISKYNLTHWRRA
jgi:hypothetical protein